MEKKEGHKWFAYIYDKLNKKVGSDREGVERKKLLKQAVGRILEVGVGNGLNTPLYPKDLEVVLTEPDHFMLKILKKKVKGKNVKIVQAGAEKLPFPDNSFDTVVSTLVFCTVPEVQKGLAEIKRVLKPDGRLLFLEHVKGDGFKGKAEDFINPVWRYFGAGCNLNRNTEEEIKKAGFKLIREGQFSQFGADHIFGIAQN